MRKIAFLLLLIPAACRSAAPAAPPATPATPKVAAPAPAAAASPAPAPSASPRLPLSVRWVQRAAEFRASSMQTYRLATAHVERAAAGRSPGTWAVVADSDETALSNVQYEIERAREGRYGEPFDAASWTAWVRRREATALPGAAAFFRRVHELGGRVAIVTNRSSEECDDTKANFETQGLPFDAMLCREGQQGDKNPRFERVRSGEAFGSGPVEVLVFLGDNIRDFPGGSQDLRKKGEDAFADFGARYFILPNPLYGSWESNPD